MSQTCSGQARNQNQNHHFLLQSISQWEAHRLYNHSLKSWVSVSVHACSCNRRCLCWWWSYPTGRNNETILSTVLANGDQGNSMRTPCFLSCKLLTCSPSTWKAEAVLLTYIARYCLYAERMKMFLSHMFQQ